jgi:hypothetical protein
LAVYPEIVTDGILIDAQTLAKGKSAYCPQASYIKSYYSAKRLTLEQININRKKMFIYIHARELVETIHTIHKKPFSRLKINLWFA